jgi:YesN/AraC family two-component response regulator
MDASDSGMLNIEHPVTNRNISAAQHDQIKAALFKSGLELIDDNKTVLSGKIKNMIRGLVHYSEEPIPLNLSVHLSRNLHHNYTYMANIFAETQGLSIARFFIKQKIERVKDLLDGSELNLTAIAYKLHYSSVAHLSAQFKKVTGATASEYRQLKEKGRLASC